MPSANEADYRALEMFVLIKIEIENLSMTVRKQKWAKVSGRPYDISYFFNYRPGSFVLLSKGFRPGGFVTEICVRADYVHGGLCLVLEHPRLHRVSCVIARDFNSLSVRLYGVMIRGP